MRTVVAGLLLAVVAAPVRADVVPAGGVEPYAGPVAVEAVSGGATRSLVARTAVVDAHAGTAVPAVTKLHPVVGSVHRGHFTHPITGASNYKSTVYNPVLGTFGTYKFRR